MGNKFKTKAFVKQATKEEMHAGFVRISENLRHEIRNGDYIQLTTNDRTIYCQVRGTPNKIDTIIINEWYRELLGINNIPDTEIELEIAKASFFGMLNAFQYHPDNIIRISLGLGISSVGLGLMSLACTGNITLSNPFVYSVRFLLAVFAIYLFTRGFSLFAGKSTPIIKKPKKQKGNK
jgi:hypothetical protein